MLREIIEQEGVTASQVREDRTSGHTRLPLQALTEHWHVTRLEAQAVHTGIYLDMNRIGRDTPTLCLPNQRLQKAEAIDLRL